MTRAVPQKSVLRPDELSSHKTLSPPLQFPKDSCDQILSQKTLSRPDTFPEDHWPIRSVPQSVVYYQISRLFYYQISSPISLLQPRICLQTLENCNLRNPFDWKLWLLMQEVCSTIFISSAPMAWHKCSSTHKLSGIIGWKLLFHLISTISFPVCILKIKLDLKS